MDYKIYEFGSTIHINKILTKCLQYNLTINDIIYKFINFFFFKVDRRFV